MRRFARLYQELDQSNKTLDKVSALRAYFDEAPDADAIWALALLSGRRPRRQVNSGQLRAWALELIGVPAWLFEESYGVVGDLGEAVSLLLPPATGTMDLSLGDTMAFLQRLSSLPEDDRRAAIQEAWMGLTDQTERMVFTKLITGSFRVGVSASLVVRALAELHDRPSTEITHRIMGDWTPATTTLHDLLHGAPEARNVSQPYPFCLAYPVDEPASLGEPGLWAAEWKWDGIRSQVIHRQGQVFIWSRGEDLVTDRFPELATLAAELPEGTVIDGEILPWVGGRLGTFQHLQQRLGRKTVPAKLLREAPVILRAYDLIEWGGGDIRHLPYHERRDLLEGLYRAHHPPGTGEAPGAGALHLSERLAIDSWGELARVRERSRELGAEGFMLKRLDSPYGVGRKRGDWFKWKVEPYAVDAVLVYAQRGSGRRADLFTDYTFAVWQGDQLVPFAKAYSGLTDEEIRRVDAWIKRHTLEKFGPVRTVTPELVFEIGFEGIQASPRHKSGIAVRFPRILRWREDKPMAEADTLETLRALLPGG